MNASFANAAYAAFFFFVLALWVLLATAYASQWYLTRIQSAPNNQSEQPVLAILRDDKMVYRISGSPDIHYIAIKNIGPVDLQKCTAKIERVWVDENSSSPGPTPARFRTLDDKKMSASLSPGETFSVDIAEWNADTGQGVFIPMDGIDKDGRSFGGAQFIRPLSVNVRIGAYASNCTPAFAEFKIFTDDRGNFKIEQRPTQT